MVVDREVGQAAAQPEQRLVGIAVPLVLFDRVGDRLLCQTVLQFEGGDRQPVDEEAEVERELGVVAAVMELPRHAEAVLTVEPLGCGVVRGRRAVEEVEAVRPVLEALAQQVDGAALVDFALQPGQELAPGGAVLL